MGKGMYKMTGQALAICGICLFLQMPLGYTTPLTVDEAVEMALGKHLDIMIAANKEEQARDALQSAEGGKQPSLSANNSFYLRQINEGATPSMTGLEVSMPLYTAGRTEGNIANAKTDVTMAGLDLRKTRQDVKLKTISGYYDVLEAQKIVAVDQETVDNYVMHLDNVRAQYSVGSIPKIDVLRSEVELADAQQSLLKARNSYNVAVNNFKNTIRWKSSESIEFVDDFGYAPLQLSMAECVAYARDTRPDLKKSQLSIEEAQRNVDIAAADQKPQVSLSAGSSWGSNILPTGDDQNYYIGVKTSWNIFDGQVTKANVRKAKKAVEVAKMQMESQQDTVEVNVKEYYMNVQEAAKRMDTTQVAVKKAEEDYYIAEAKYQAGEGVILDVIDAQLALSTARNNYIAAQYDYAVYTAKLDNAMGKD